jgi:Zn-dependent peptidase ImmA (M78 family)
MKEKIQINAEALDLRKILGEDVYSPVDIFSLLSSVEDMTVVFYPMGDQFSGMCLRDGKNKIIGINSTQTLGRQRFTAAHELCHLYYHDTITGIVCIKEENKKKTDPLEKEANLFASFFLAPYEALSSFIKKNVDRELEIKEIIKIEQYFGLSRQATLWRLIDDGYLSFEKAELMKAGIVSTAAKYGYSTELYFPPPEEKQYMTFGKYIKIAEELREKNLISKGKYEELLLDAFRSDIVYGLDAAGEERYDEKAVF